METSKREGSWNNIHKMKFFISANLRSASNALGVRSFGEKSTWTFYLSPYTHIYTHQDRSGDNNLRMTLMDSQIPTFSTDFDEISHIFKDFANCFDLYVPEFKSPLHKAGSFVNLVSIGFLTNITFFFFFICQAYDL